MTSFNPSGRVTDVLPQIDHKTFQEYVSYSQDSGIEFNYTINASCLGNIEFSQDGMYRIVDLLKQIKSYGVNSLTVASPQMMEMVKATGFDFKIKASAICEITSPMKASFYKHLGVERIVVDPDITRNFTQLENISKTFGEGVEIIINNVCFKNCAYKMFHYNHEAHCNSHNKQQTVKDYFFNRCSMQKAGDCENVIKLNWIRPEDLVFYRNSGYSYFKIQGRQNVISGDVVRTLKHYFEESYDGNLYDLLTLFSPYNSFQTYIDNAKLEGFVKTFYEHRSFCKEMCDNCSYCGIYAKKSLNIEESQKLNEQSLTFYKNFDSYSQQISELTATPSDFGVGLNVEDLEEDFAFEEVVGATRGEKNIK